MEAWVVADAKALAAYYGQGFAGNVLPKRPNLEDEPKLDIYDKLARAVLGRSPKHTLLVHHNLLNALFLDDIIQMFKDKGWKTN